MLTCSVKLKKYPRKKLLINSSITFHEEKGGINSQTENNRSELKCPEPVQSSRKRKETELGSNNTMTDFSNC